MKDRRKWSRFRVSSRRSLRAKILEGYDRNSLIHSISLGGCGFVSNRADARLLLNPRVRVELQFGQQRFVVEGKVQYCRLMPHKGFDRNIVGIEFDWQESDQTKQFQELLGHACRDGELEMSMDS